MKTVIHTEKTKELMSSWQDLWENSPERNYFNGPAWFKSVFDTYHPSEIKILTIVSNHKLLAITSLFKIKKYGFTVYTMIPEDFVCGSPILFDPNYPEANRLLLETVLSLGTTVINNLQEITLKNLKRNSSSLKAVQKSVNYFLNFDNKVAISNSTEHRWKKMRKIYKLRDKFELDIGYGLSDQLEIAFKIDYETRKQRRGYATFNHHEYVTLYRNLASNLGNSLETHLLYYEGNIIAYEIGYRIYDTYYGSQLAFIEKYGELTPGKVIAILLVEHLLATGAKTLDFSSGDNYVKRMFTKTRHDLFDVVISNNFFKSSILITIMRLHEGMYNTLSKHRKLYSFYKALSLS